MAARFGRGLFNLEELSAFDFLFSGTNAAGGGGEGIFGRKDRLVLIDKCAGLGCKDVSGNTVDELLAMGCLTGTTGTVSNLAGAVCRRGCDTLDFFSDKLNEEDGEEETGDDGGDEENGDCKKLDA